MVFRYLVTRNDGTQKTVLLDDDSPAINKMICTQNAGYYRITDTGQTLLLHRWPVDAKEGDIVDHRDWDKDNNTTANLRIVTKAQNAYNMQKVPNNTSGSIGVSHCTGKGRSKSPWTAGIKMHGRRIHIGSFSTKEEAQIAYDMTCFNLRGQFAVLNNPDHVFKNRMNLI